MKRKFLASLVCICLFIATILSSCTSGNGGTQTGETTQNTTGAEPTQATTATTAATQATTQATTSGETVIPDPVQLTAVIKDADKNQILSRLDPPITVEIYNGVTKDLNYHGWPTICQGDGETIYAASSVRTEHIDIYGAVGFTKSLDGGKTWEDVRIIIDTPLDDRDSGIVYLGDGHLMVTWFTHDASLYREKGGYAAYRERSTAEQLTAVDARLDSLTSEEKTRGSYVAHSYDGGETWGDPIAIPVTTPHSATLMNDGETLVVAGKPWGPAANGLDYNRIYIFTSKDGGLTWHQLSSLGKPDVDVGFGEAHIIQLMDGSFIVGVRCETQGMSIQVARSENGVDWTPFTAIRGLVGGPPHFLQLKDGTLVLTYSYRFNNRNSGVRARISYDGGKTWDKTEFILEISDTPNNSDLGYPSSVQLADGSILTAYYQRSGKDSYCSVLYTTWKLVPADSVAEGTEG